jgi:response regulator RpfG family c-di-GMP phosphodiesterase
MTRRILFVDDEPNVLDGFRRTLRRDYEFDTAVGGHDGLDLLNVNLYAVVVSDMRMPIMSGEEFLAKAHEVQPDAIQMILSGQANLESTVAAVNGGNIFRFLVKPVEKDALTAALDKALEQFRLISAERQLLEGTLSGAVEALTEVVGLVSPAVTKRTRHVVELVENVASAYDLDSDWQMRLASMLSGVGYTAVPSDVLAKAELQQPLSNAEQAMMARHPEVTAQLLDHIPRLEGVTAIISAAAGVASPPDELDPHVRVLVFANAAADLLLLGRTIDEALIELERSGDHDPVLIKRAAGTAKRKGTVIEDRSVGRLAVGMTLRQDVFTVTDVMLANAGTTLRMSLLERLRNFEQSVGIQSPITVEFAVTGGVGVVEDGS